MIDRLEQAGHVRRVRDTVDRRRVTVTETDAARRASEDAWGPVVHAIDDHCATLPAAERETVLRFFRHLTDVITGLAPS